MWLLYILLESSHHHSDTPHHQNPSYSVIRPMILHCYLLWRVYGVSDSVCIALFHKFPETCEIFLYLYYTEIQKAKETAQDHPPDRTETQTQVHLTPESFPLCPMDILKYWQFSDWTMLFLHHQHPCNISSLCLHYPPPFFASWLTATCTLRFGSNITRWDSEIPQTEKDREPDWEAGN